MTQLDSADLGTKENANSESSSSTANQKSSEPEYITVEKFKELLAQEREQLRRQAQSEKDKAVKNVSERLTGLETDVKTILQRAATSGKSASDVLKEMNDAEEAFNRQMIAEMAQAWKSGRFVPGTQGSETRNEVDVDGVIEEFGLDVEDRRVAAFRTRSFETIEAAEIAAAKLVKQIQTTPTPSDASRASREGEPPAPVAKIAQLQAEYDEKAKTARGNALINLKMEYRKKGLPVS